MSSSYDELLEFFSPKAPIRPDVRFAALKLAEEICGSPEGQELLLQDNNKLLVSIILLFSESEKFVENSQQQFQDQIFRIFVNPTADRPGICSELTRSSLFLSKLLENVCQIQSAAKVACNLSVDDGNCEKLAENVPDLTIFLKNLTKSFLSDAEIGDFLGYFLRNLSQNRNVRRILVAKNGRSSESKGKGSLLDEITSVLKVGSAKTERRKVAADLIANCCIDAGLHPDLVNSEEFLVILLYPLLGPEELREEENDKLPLDLQYMESTKKREGNPEIRYKLLQSLFQLCSNSAGRIFLRDNGTYGVMRVYHLWEVEENCKEMCENVVQMLIQTEEEIGPDSGH